MVTLHPVVVAALHATLLENGGQNRTDTDRSGRVFQEAPCRYRSRGKPRFTFVSDGNPLRRLLLGSNRNSVYIAVSPFKWIARHIRKD
jgi:hypothetical protein